MHDLKEYGVNTYINLVYHNKYGMAKTKTKCDKCGQKQSETRYLFTFQKTNKCYALSDDEQSIPQRK